ncbi:uncharacterized protein LOC120087065 isoform X2 [Benincasa hispida]|uniref:uncharacterized protein LOC120087065 isoform X2 n=1 Tax=Benincasa hispida TaxID=102211 RepID=UPI00190044D2|nr:uncharacterized protein LOC120087065 isoform X2 [Benincasa hispida]
MCHFPLQSNAFAFKIASGNTNCPIDLLSEEQAEQELANCALMGRRMDAHKLFDKMQIDFDIGIAAGATVEMPLRNKLNYILKVYSQKKEKRARKKGYKGDGLRKRRHTLFHDDADMLWTIGRDMQELLMVLFVAQRCT